MKVDYQPVHGLAGAGWLWPKTRWVARLDLSWQGLLLLISASAAKQKRKGKIFNGTSALDGAGTLDDGRRMGMMHWQCHMP